MVQETKKYFLILTVVTAIVVLFPSLNRPQSRVAGDFTPSGSTLPIAEERHVPAPEAKSTVSDLGLGAAAVLVKDLRSGTVMYEKNSHERLPVASLTKLMTALVAKEQLRDDETVKIVAADIDVPQQRAGLLVGESLRAGDLLAAMLIGSCNDAALALARAGGGTVLDFVVLMNEKARALGMRDTIFANPVGLDDLQHFSTAADLSLLVEEFLRHPELVALTGTRAATVRSLDGKHIYDITTTNKLLLKDPAVLGLKTGYTTEAKGNLILLVEDHHDGEEQVFYTIVLGSDNREAESEQVLSWIRENFIWK